MELLNRYLHAVGARLPDTYREDIVAELRGELLSRIAHLTAPRRGAIASHTRIRPVATA